MNSSGKAEHKITRRDFVKDAAFGAAAMAIVGSFGLSTPAQAQTKHGGLIRKINYNMKEAWKVMGPGNADRIWWPRGNELGGEMSISLSDITPEWVFGTRGKPAVTTILMGMKCYFS